MFIKHLYVPGTMEDATDIMMDKNEQDSSYKFNLVSLFQIVTVLITASLLIMVSRTSGILNNNSDDVHNCLIPDFNGNIFSRMPQSFLG